MKTIEELGLIQRLRLRWNDWRMLRKLRELRALLVSFGLDPDRADDAVVEIFRAVPVPAFDDLPASAQQQYL